MDRTPVESTQIKSIGFDQTTNTLEVEFAKGGAVYQYKDVTRETFDLFLAAESKGRFFGQAIRGGGFEFTRLPEPEKAETPAEG